MLKVWYIPSSIQEDEIWSYWWPEIIVKVESLLSKSSILEENLTNWLLRMNFFNFMNFIHKQFHVCQVFACNFFVMFWNNPMNIFF